MPPIEYFGVMIPILAISLGFFAVWAEHQRKMIRLRIEELNAAKEARGAAPEQAREVNQLQERVRVLERIVTDGGYDLAAKIEALREERPAIERPAETERLS
jgi:16S rRNA G527 N7-methylase RsmG